jgi:hypothetical protein
MTNATQIKQTTEKAIAANIAIEMNALRTAITKFIIAETHSANSAGLGLHRGYAHLQSELVPALEAKLIAYCLDVGISDVDFITGQIRNAFVTGLSAMGQSIGVSHQSGNPGLTMRNILNFKGWVTAYCAGLSARVLVAVERYRGTSGAGNSIVVQSVSGTYVQIGHENNLTTVNITLQQLAQEIANSKDPEAKSLLHSLLNNATVGAMLGAGATELLAKLFGG